jgi:hypothetical protein
MYKVIRRFADTHDNKRIYEVGDTYPRDGFTPNKGRAEALASGKKGAMNKTGRIYLQEEKAPEA